MFAPRASAKSKTVTSGRLTGAVKADRTRGTLKSRPEASYSLYSEDAEDQVATLNKGLDRCAALLSDILHCENQGAVPKQDRAVKEGGAKCRPHTPTGKKAIRRSVSKSASNPRSAQTVRRKTSTKPPATKPPATTPQRSPAPPHSGVSLHPPVRKPHLMKTPSKPANPYIQPFCPSALPAGPPAAPDSVPERDQRLVGVSETEDNMRRVQGLLGELRTLMAGHGDSAQMYLRLLEQTVSSLLGSENSKNQTEQPSTEELKALQSHNVQLQRQVTVLRQQIQEQEATQQLLNSQVSRLQEQLSVADKELTRVQNVLQETEGRLRSREEESISLKTEMESTRARLRLILQDKLKLEGALQQKQQEIEGLHRIIDSCDSSTPTPDNQPACPPGAATERITQYLLSLEQSRPTRPISPLLQALVSHQGPERDVESAVSDWSVQSESSFNTRDEAAFRDGLAALDASIASLQKTLRMDLVKT